MKTLAPNLFQRRFQNLVEIGRALLPELAPDWTDHNAHDPGITLMELLAWTAEAQLYGLSRMRRDERAAYAALLGIAPAGTQSARGLIWPGRLDDRLDPASPAATFNKSVVLPTDTVIHLADNENPTFRPTHTLLWTPGRIVRLETRAAHERSINHTLTNARGGVPFQPFGVGTGRGATLALTFECRDQAGVFGRAPQNARKACWAIGVQAAPPLGSVATQAQPVCAAHQPLTAMLVAGNESFALHIVSDTSLGLLTTGALLLDLGNVSGSPRQFTIELQAPNGFPRPPRVLRLEPNVIPLQQGQFIDREAHAAHGLPDWSFTLEEPGLRFVAGAEPLTLEVRETGGAQVWQRCERLAECGPADNVYELDAPSGQVRFGNGVNGRVPPAGSTALVSYAVADGAAGNVARNRSWQVAGFSGVFGVNPDPIMGGTASADALEERRAARRRSREEHALVSATDVAEAALALPLLEVARAWTPEPAPSAPRTGAVTLVALRSRPTGAEPESAPETALWLEAIRRRLTPRMPLGARLVVAAPRYVEFSLHALLEAHPGRKPEDIEAAVKHALQKRLALVAAKPGELERQPGVAVTRRDVAAWLRAVEGVRRVIHLEVRRADGKGVESISVPRHGLPRWVAERSLITVQRPAPGRSQ